MPPSTVTPASDARESRHSSLMAMRHAPDATSAKKPACNGHSLLLTPRGQRKAPRRRVSPTRSAARHSLTRAQAGADIAASAEIACAITDIRARRCRRQHAQRRRRAANAQQASMRTSPRARAGPAEPMATVADAARAGRASKAPA